MKLNKIILLLSIAALLSSCSTTSFYDLTPSAGTVVSPSTQQDSSASSNKQQETEIPSAKKNQETIPEQTETFSFSKEELSDGVYLIKDDIFIPIPTIRPGISREALYIIDPDDSLWLSASHGDTIAFKGNFSPNQEIDIECSTSDYYSFPNTFNLAMDGGLSINSVNESSSTLAVDSIIINNDSYPDLLVSGENEEGWYSTYIQNLNWEINSLGWNGYYLDGGFPKGYTATFTGFQGTNYVEIELAATCHIINMPDETLSDQDYHMKGKLQTTKDGYFTLTIPDDVFTGYYEFFIPGLNGYNFYLKIE